LIGEVLFQLNAHEGGDEMGRVGQFVRRHWLGILSLAGVGVAVATGFATRRYGASAPRRPQRASDSA